MKLNTIDENIKFINTREFSKEALNFMANGYYCHYPEGTFGYREYWEEQTKRCIYGYSIGGIKITGLHYFYLNFCQIKATIEENGSSRKILTFPKFLDMDYHYFNEVENARLNKEGLIAAKARRKGFSFKNAALCVHQYEFFKDSTSIIGAYLDEYAQATMDMALEMINFINTNTAWYKRRNPDKRDHIKARYKINDNGKEVWKGYNSELYTLTFKDNFSAAIGKTASIFLFEEAGKWLGLIDAYMITAPVFRDGDLMTGIPLIFGCVCKGTKVWTKAGELKNIEDLKKEDGILGLNHQQAFPENISYLKPPAKKLCYRITTNTGNILECSEDHPILWSKRHYDFIKRETKNRERIVKERFKKVLFKETKDIKVGEQIVIINAVSIFGNTSIWEPRLVGMLIGDGSYGIDKTPVLSNCDEEILSYIHKKYDTVIEKQYITTLGKTYQEVRIKNITKNLRELGIYGQTKTKKRLPKAIWTASKKDVTELLAGLFDTDGYINKNSSVINITSSSKELLIEIKYLCIKLGIHGSINEIKADIREGRKDKNNYFRFVIADAESLYNFYKNISLLCKYKQKALNGIPDYVTHIHSQLKKRAIFVKRNELNKRYNDITDVEGIRFETITKIENIGEQDIYNLTAEDTHTYIANNIVTHNTGGDIEAGSADFAEMFYNPEKYWLRSYNNIYDEGCDGKACGLFIDDRWYKPGKILIKSSDISPEKYPKLFNEFITQNKTEISFNMVDEEGNSNREAVDIYLDRERVILKNTDSRRTWEKYITQSPKTPREAFLQVSGNIFPTIELNTWLGELETTGKAKNSMMLGDLFWDKDKVKWTPNKNLKPIMKFPIRDVEDSEGCVVIWEHPYKDTTGEIPPGLYLAGLDPIDQDSAGTTSLGSLFIYKTFQSFDRTYQLPVAEYTGRPEKAEMFYENARKLITYYNAKCLYENNLKGFKIYLEQKKSLHLLKEQPGIIKDIVKSSTTNRGYGIHMSEPIKRQAEIYLRDWLLTKKADTEGENTKYNLHSIYSIPLLQELIAYTVKGNYDRVIAFMLCILHEHENFNITVKKEVTHRKFAGTILDRNLFQNKKSSRLNSFR